MLLLVIDMQRGFLESSRPLYCGDNAGKIIPRVQELIENTLQNGGQVIFTQDSHAPDDLEFKMFLPHCIRGTEEEEIIKELANYPGIRIKKTRYSAFYGTSLEDVLKKLQPKEVGIVGVCSDICVLHTVADLRNRDYKVTVFQDAIATFDPEAHNFALRHMKKILGAEIR